MEIKYFCEEITTMVNKDEPIAHALTEKNSFNEALSSALMACGYALINENVAHIHAEAKSNDGKQNVTFDYDVNSAEVTE